jgi:hypothetical protein
MCNEGKLKVQGGMQLKYRDSSNEVTEVDMYNWIMSLIRLCKAMSESSSTVKSAKRVTQQGLWEAVLRCVLLQSPQNVQAMLNLFDQGWGVDGSGEVLGDADTQEFEAGHTLHLNAINENWGVAAAFTLSVIHNALLGFLCIEDQVVVRAPYSQVLDLLPVADTSLSLIRHTTVMPSANLMMVLERCTGTQS